MSMCAETSERTNVDYGPIPTSAPLDTYDEGEPDPPQAESKWRNRATSWWRRPFSGWRGGLARWTAGATLVLFLNIAVAIVAGVSWRPIEGIATAYTGDCQFTSRLNKGLHLLVNLLSTLLLGASNYCMQRLVAPTRQEIDTTHAQRKWLDIGVPGWRNLDSISGLRLGLWLLLGISSVPLHFVYNSVLFETQGDLIVEFTLVDPIFFTQDANYPDYPDIALWQNHLLNGQYLNTSLWENLTSDECILRYTAPAILDVGDGFGVPTLEYRNAHGLNTTPASSFRAFTLWNKNKLTTDDHGYTVAYDYCLSQKVPQQPCRLQFSQTILYLVIACNVGRVAAMIAMLQKLDHNTIVTVGDAVQSFIRVPDGTTKDCCLVPKADIVKAWSLPLESRHGVAFQNPKKVPWFTAASWRRWIISLLLYITTICIAIVLYTRTKPYCDEDGNCKTNGFGNFDLDFTVGIDILQDGSVYLPILLANLPQAIIAFLYLTYNGLFTAMLVNREWTQYSIKRASLRVTDPSPSQRSTYFLSLPYTISIPLQIAFIALHWLVSQSIFLARVDNLDAHQWNMDNNGTWQNIEQLEGLGNGVRSALGYSAPAILTSIGVGSGIVVMCLLVAAITKYPAGGMPLGGTNSAVISAACHLLDADGAQKESEMREEIVNTPLKWGVTKDGSRNEAGHCSFSNGEVRQPIVGVLYSGIASSSQWPV